jgi:hypothetical protein
LDVDRKLGLGRGGFAPPREAAGAARAVAVAGLGVRGERAEPGRDGAGAAEREDAGRDGAGAAEREDAGRDGVGAAEREEARGASPDRSDDGRAAGGRLESISDGDVAERSLRAAGVTAVGVMLSSDLQLAGGAQVR